MIPTLSTLADIVRLFPERGSRTALRFFNGLRVLPTSYKELYTNALRVATLFQEYGVQRGDRILLWAPNRPEWATVFCACVLRGVVLVPLDARNSAGFVRFVAKETEAKLLIRTQFKNDPGLGIPGVILEGLLERISDRTPAPDNETLSPDDIAQIIYTSGTTGNPKGVVLRQGNQASNVNAILRRVPANDTYHMMSVLPLSHALEQIGGFWIPMTCGGSVLYISVLKPSAMNEMFRRETITSMVVVPRLLTLLKDRIESQMRDKKMSGYLSLGMTLAPSLSRAMRKLLFYPVHKRFNTGFHAFVCGGSALPLGVERFWRNLGFRIVKGYGLTETSPVLSVEGLDEWRLGSVGRALDNVELQLDDNHEILAKGPSVFTGYYQRDDVNATSFEEGWFKTGDVGEIDSEGFVFIRSRKKDIIVTSDGINIYPEDIEAVLDRLPDVKESCVLGLGEQEDEVHAVLLPASESFDADAIIKQANASLTPEQRIQSCSVWSEPEFPKTTTLKIKKNEVRKSISIQQQDDSTPAAISGSALVQILHQLSDIPVEQITPESMLGNDLGLSSITRVELISMLESEFRLDISETEVQPETTVESLQALVNNRNQKQDAIPFRRWTCSPPVHLIRRAFEETVMRCVLGTFCNLHLMGEENLKGLEGPVLIAANHTSHVDTPLIKSLLPHSIGRRTCPAAWYEYFVTAGHPFPTKVWQRFAWEYATIFENIIPLPQTASFRQTMLYAGELVDRGWSVLIFPEGTRSTDGKLRPFQDGTGMMAQGLSIPVLPVAITGGEGILYPGKAIPRRNAVAVSFGAPFSPESLSGSQITQRIYEIILQMRTDINEKWPGRFPTPL